MRWAWEADVHLGPVNTHADLLRTRTSPSTATGRTVGGTRTRGPRCASSRSHVDAGRPAPTLGADQAADRRVVERRRPSGCQDRSDGAAARRGVRGAEGARPQLGRRRPDHGEGAGRPRRYVVRVESSTRVDYVRTLQPFKDNVVGINRSHYMNNLNTSKLGVALNLATEDGRAWRAAWPTGPTWSSRTSRRAR